MSLSTSLALMSCEWRLQHIIPPLNDETHVWAIELRKSPSYLEQQFQWLSEREKDKAQRMLVESKRDFQIQARGWLRWVLAGYLGVTPGRVNYKYGSLGKPYLDNGSNPIYFNATDSDTTMLCAFSAKNEMGIDVESTPRSVKFQRIAEKKYTFEEQALIDSFPCSDQSNAFLAIWTRKEAFGKALGVGIRYPMNQYYLCNDFDNYHTLISDKANGEWHLFQFNYQNNIACLITRQSHENIQFYKLELDALDLV